MTSNELLSPYPFKKVAFALAFSPRLDAIIAEAARIQKLLECRLVFIHIGKRDPAKEQELEQMIRKENMPVEKWEVVWQSGSPAREILDICHRENIDLLVMGALQKESVLAYYIGSVARKVCRKCDFSVLLLTDPQLTPVPVNRIVVSAPEHPKTPFTIATAVYWSKKFNSSRMYVVRESSMYGFARMIRDNTPEESRQFEKRFMDQENANLDQVLKNLDYSELNISTKIVSGKPGYEISRFAIKHSADLLVVNSPDSRLGIMDRFFPHDLEHVLAELPCSLLIVHPPEKET